jgi:serine/threonine-protein kinase
MASVYLAMASGPAGFHKLVVIKLITAELAEDPDFVTMFLDEARLAARLNHPNVVQTNEVGHEGNRYFIAMEYLEGQTLQRVLYRLGRGPTSELSTAAHLRIICDALAGLHHAHELCDFDGTPLGVVHRDVSPHNLFVTYAGQVKVVDFGIAKALNSSHETRAGMLKGKIGYMAPEHARGDRVDRRADIYAVGVMLWELAAGQRLFKGQPEVQIIQRLIANDIPCPSQVDPNVDLELESIVLRAMSYRPEDRYPTAAALAEALEEYLRARGSTATTRDVGQLIAERFADDRTKIKTLIEQQIDAVEQPIESSLPLLDLAPPSVTHAARDRTPTLAASLRSQDTAITVSRTSIPQTPPPPRRRPLFLAAGVARSRRRRLHRLPPADTQCARARRQALHAHHRFAPQRGKGPLQG